MSYCLRELRERSKLTPEEVSRLSGVGAEELAELEEGKRDVISSKALLAIVKALGATLSDVRF